MKFKLDENLPEEAAFVLSTAGHDADTIQDEGLTGAADEIVAQCVRNGSRVLVTLDLDFCDIRTYPPQDFAGIIVIRPKFQDKRTILSFVRRLIPLLTAEPLAGHLWIVGVERIRIWPAESEE